MPDQLTLNGFNVDGNGNMTVQQVTCAGALVSAGQVRARAAKTANYTITALDDIIAYTTIAAPRTITLPAASAVPAGQQFTVKDEAGNAGTNNLTIARAGSDTIDGGTSLVINTNYGEETFYSDGVSKWFSVTRSTAVQAQLAAKAAATTQGVSTPHWAGTTAGTATAYTCDTVPAYTSAAALTGDMVAVKFNQTNGATPTLAVGTLAAKPILVNGLVPDAAALVTTKTYIGVYDGTSWDFR